MTRLLPAFFLLLMAISVSAQPSSVQGAILDASGVPAANAPIQVKNKTTGAVAQTTSRSDGRYTFSHLAAGAYDFSIVMPCCAYKNVLKELVLKPGTLEELNIKLEETVNGTTLGDDPGRLAVAIRNRAKVPSGPAPRAAGGKPDLSGVWVATDDPYPEEPALLPWAEAVLKQRNETNGKDAPHNHCLPAAPPVPGSAAPFLEKFVQTGSLLVILFEDVPGFRQVFLDGRAHPSDLDPTWMGHSVGKWDGDSLVVDTIGFNDRSWLGGLGGGRLPHTEMLHMTERYNRVDYGHMDVVVTFEDSGTFLKPYRMNVRLDLAPQEDVMEFVCENNKPEHLVGK
jgi:hypothetical protein